MTRFLIAIGTEDYEDESIQNLDGVPDEVAAIEDLFCGRFGYTRALPELGLNPSRDTLLERIEDFLRAPERCAEDAVAVYWTGHGFFDGGTHYLALADTQSGRIAGTVEPETLIKLLGSESAVRRLLVIFDVCFAGEGANAFIRAAEPLSRRVGVPPGRGEGLWVVASARRTEGAGQGVFTKALTAAVDEVERVTGRSQSHLGFEPLFEAVNRMLERTTEQRAGWAVAGLAHGLPPFLPNRGLGPSVQRHETLAHWDPRARGVARAGDSGDHFSGRVAAMKSLVDAVAARRSLLLTGHPGAGKSALLSRLVLLADAERQSEITPSGPTPAPASIAAGILAHGKSADAIRQELDAALEMSSDGPAPVVVVDAVDEAQDPALLLQDVLEPLADRACLIIGKRRGTPGDASFLTTVIDLDEATYRDDDGVARYAARLLTAPSASPYCGADDAASDAAQAIAATAEGNFLIAGLLARSLARRGTIADAAALRGATSEVSVRGALNADLSRHGDAETTVRDLLTPLAFARGAGLPWESVWARLATALTVSGHSYSDGDVRLFLESGAPYVVESREDDRAVFRLFHDALADTLRADAPLGSEATERTITEVLAASARASEWTHAHPYVRRHLAAHAAVGGSLEELVGEVGFLVEGDVGALSRASGGLHGTPAADTVAITEMASMHLRRRDRADRAAGLALVARQQGADDLAAAADHLAQQHGAHWRVRWTDWRPARPHRIVTRVSGAVRGLSAGHACGRTLAAVTGVGGRVLVIDLGDGTTVYAGRHPEVRRCTILQLGGRAVLGIGGAEVLRLVDLADGSGLARWPAHPSPSGPLAAGRVGAREVLVTSGRDHDGFERPNASQVRVWDATTCKPVGPKITAFAEGGVRSVELVDGVLIVAGDVIRDPGGLIRRFDPVTGMLLGSLAPADNDYATAFVEEDGRVLVMRTDSVERWNSDAAEPEQRVALRARDSAVVDAGDRRIVVARVEDRVRVIDAATFALLGEIDTGWVDRIAAVEHDGQALLLAAQDSTVRSWSLLSALGDLAGSAPPPLAVAASGDTVVVSRVDGTLERRDRQSGAVLAGAARTARPVPQIRNGADGNVYVLEGTTVRRWSAAGDFVDLAIDDAVCLAVDLQSGLLAVAGEDRAVRLHDLETGKRRSPSLHDFVPPNKAIQAVAFATLHGRRYVLAGGGDEEVWAWDVEAALAAGPAATASELDRTTLTLARHRDWVRAIAASGAGEPFAAYSAGRDGTIMVLGEEDERTAHHRAHDADIRRMVAGTADDVPALLTADATGTLRLWHRRNQIQLLADIELGAELTDVDLDDGLAVAATSRGLVAIDFKPNL